MTEQHLKTRLAELEAAIEKSDAATRATLVSQLERVTRTLEQKSAATPRSRGALRAAQDEDALEALFDNMPI